MLRWASKRCQLEELNISQFSLPPYSLHLQINLFLNMIHFCITRYNSEIIAVTSSGLQVCNALPLITRIKAPASSHWSQFVERSPAAWSKSLWATCVLTVVCKAAQPCGVETRTDVVRADSSCGKDGEGRRTGKLQCGCWALKTEGTQCCCLNTGICCYLRYPRVVKVDGRWMADTWTDLWEAITQLTYQLEWGDQVGYPCVSQDIFI